MEPKCPEIRLSQEYSTMHAYIKKSQLLATGITLHQEWLSLKETITTMKNMMLDFIVGLNVYLCSGICFGILKYPSFVYLFVPS